MASPLPPRPSGRSARQPDPAGSAAAAPNKPAATRPAVKKSGGPTAGRTTGDVHLTATKPTEPAAVAEQPGRVRYGWQLVAVGGALTAALAGWIIVTGLSVVGWLAAALSGAASDLADAIRAGTSVWLLTNGAPLELGGVHWSLIPLGMSLLTVFMISRFARAAARFAAPDAETDEDLDERDRLGIAGRLLLGITGLSTVSFAAVVAAVGLGTGVAISRGIVGAAIIAAVGSAWGASRGLGIRLSDVLPNWARSLPAAVAAGVGILLVCGGAVLATGIVLHADRIGALTAALGAGTVGGIALWAAQAAFLPNLIVWSASYGLGAGFGIGHGTVVAPSDVTLGLLPAFPVLGALPHSGAGSWAGLCWLAFGVAAGVAAAAVVVRRRPDARVDETALVGGLAGLLAGLVFTGLSAASIGDLGSGRLSGTGPRMLALLVMSGTLLGLSGLLYGSVVGIVRLVREFRTSRNYGIAAEAVKSTVWGLRHRARRPAEQQPRAVVEEADEPTARVAVRRTAANTTSTVEADAAKPDTADTNPAKPDTAEPDTAESDTAEPDTAATLRAELDAAGPSSAVDPSDELTSDPRAGAEPQDAEATVRVEDPRTA